jgi:hypothetical protein
MRQKAESRFITSALKSWKKAGDQYWRNVTGFFDFPITPLSKA